MGWAFVLPSGRPVHVIAPWHPIQRSVAGRYVWRDDENSSPDAIVVSGLAWSFHNTTLNEQLNEIEPGLAAEFSLAFAPPEDWFDWLREEAEAQRAERDPEERLERVVTRLEKLVAKLEGKSSRKRKRK